MIRKSFLLLLALLLSGCTTIAVSGNLSAYDDRGQMQESWRGGIVIVLDAPAYGPTFGGQDRQQVIRETY